VHRFLLVSLNIRAILQEKTLHRRREKISAMRGSAGLADAYDARIGEIIGQQVDNTRLGLATLMWISHSERPLKVDEICHALAVEIGSTTINTDKVPSILTVLGSCQGLVTVDKGSSIIRLVHFTFKEYISGHPALFSRAHSKIAEICLTYLNFQETKNCFSRTLKCFKGTLPFLEYSSLYWGTHMRTEVSDRARSLALSLLCQYDHHISAKFLHESTVDRFFYSQIPPSAFHCISYFGIDNVAIDLMRAKGWDVNQKDSAGLTLLMWAARYGCEEVVKVLLQHRNTIPDMKDKRYGRTALSWAAGSGHEGVVKLFHSPLFADPGNIGRWWGITPQVTSLLFGKKYVNPDRPDRIGQTPLSWAAQTGHDGVVKLLLGQGDINPNRQDNYNRTPLLLAAQNGHEGVVQLLLGQEGIRPNQPDNYNRTPLSLAARNGHDRVVGLLLKHEDISPDRPDNDGQRPLAWAAWHGHERVVKLLLGREDVSPNKPNTLGQTPLSLAAQNMHDGIVKLLLEQDVSPYRPDNRGKRRLTRHKVAKNISRPRDSRGLVVNLPVFTLQKVQGFTPEEVVTWLNDISFFSHFGSADEMSSYMKVFLHNFLSGSVLLEHGYDFRWLLGFLPLGLALMLEKLIRGLYLVASISPYPSTVAPSLTWIQVLSCLAISTHEILCPGGERASHDGVTPWCYLRLG